VGVDDRGIAQLPQFDVAKKIRRDVPKSKMNEIE